MLDTLPTTRHDNKGDCGLRMFVDSFITLSDRCERFVKKCVHTRVMTSGTYNICENTVDTDYQATDRAATN